MSNERSLFYFIKLIHSSSFNFTRHLINHTIAGLKLENEVIYRIIRKDNMQESSVFRSIQEEAEARAKARERREIAFNLLKGGVDINLIVSSTGLLIEEVQQLQQQLENSSD